MMAGWTTPASSVLVFEVVEERKKVRGHLHYFLVDGTAAVVAANLRPPTAFRLGDGPTDRRFRIAEPRVFASRAAVTSAIEPPQHLHRLCCLAWHQTRGELRDDDLHAPLGEEALGTQQHPKIVALCVDLQQQHAFVRAKYVVKAPNLDVC